MLVSEATYRRVTGQVGNVAAGGLIVTALTDAEALLEDELSRPIAFDDYTEKLPLISDPETGTLAVFPTVFPVWSTSQPADLIVRFDTIYGVGPVATPVAPGDFGAIFPLVGSVTYSAGWNSAEASSATPEMKVPAYVERDLCWAAFFLLHPSNSLAVPVGVTSARSGDAAVTYKNALTPASFGIVWSPNTLAWKRRTM